MSDPSTADQDAAYDALPMDASTQEIMAVAEAIAKARAEGYAQCQADVVAWLDGVGTQYMQGDMVPCDEFVGEAYHQARDEVRAGKHKAGK